MRLLVCVGLFSLLGGCRSAPRPIQNLELTWRGDSTLGASTTVNNAFARGDFWFQVVDTRPDKTRVGLDEDLQMAVRTNDDVAVFVAEQIAILFRNAGARLNPSVGPRVTIELAHFDVVEGGMYMAEAHLRVMSTNGRTFDKLYIGKSKRWGKSRSAENYNEALSNALSSAVHRVLHDEEFGASLLGTTAPGGAPGPTL